MIAAGDVKRIQYRGTNNDNKINAEDLDNLVREAGVKDGDQVEVQIGSKVERYNNWTNDIKKDIQAKYFSDVASNVDISKAHEQLNASRSRISDLTRQVNEAETALNQLKSSKTPDTNAIKQAEQKVEALKARLQAEIKLYEQVNRSISNKPNQGLDASAYKAANLPFEGEGAKASVTVTSNSAQPSSQAQPQSKATTAQAAGFTPPATWGAATPFSGKAATFNTDAFIATSNLENNILSSFDAVLNNQSQGKKLMQLFFYFARMAESGDLGAMYQFMKFLTVIISKDKAKQQIDMGTKLIQLQDLSRKWTDKLLNTQTDASDPNSSNELAKTMQRVKSETDAIATSQKLISQMMEEFSQIVETLTNATKAALEANGRVMRTVSSMR